MAFDHDYLVIGGGFARDWEKRITTFTVMQDLENVLSITYQRKWWRLFRRSYSQRPPDGA